MERERREFIRVARELSVSYRFVSEKKDKDLATTYKGKALNVSARGLLLQAKLPKAEWIEDLLANRMALAVNLSLGKGMSVRAICQMQWLDITPKDDKKTYEMGLESKEITEVDRQKLMKHVIDAVL